MKTKMNQRAFTLYTALLSFVLILLAGLLVNTMINAERVSNEVILEVQAQSRMQSLADLTRADALQVVNYGIRNAIEEYTQQLDNPYLYAQQTTQWQDVIDDFSAFFFGAQNGSVIAGRIAANLHVIVQSGPRRIAGYTVTIQGGNETDLKLAIENVFAQTVSSGQNFLQVVKCTDATPPIECVGTFYVNLDFSQISDTEYEQLPSIHVKDDATGRELVEPVIPRGKFRIYVPLRIFRALKYAHEIAQGSLAGGGGILSPQFHAHLGELGVGMCDEFFGAAAINCGYRNAPFTRAPSPVGPSDPSPPIQGGNLCPADNVPPPIEHFMPKHVPLYCDALAIQFFPALCPQGTSTVIAYYDPADGVSRGQALSQLTQGLINQQVNVTIGNIPQSNDFVLLNNNVQIQPQVNSYDTKTISFQGINSLDSVAKCTKLTNTNVTLQFEERNLNYVVVDTRGPLHYEIKIVDSFAANLNTNQCIAYCLEEPALNVFIVGPTFTNNGPCAATACAPPGSYAPVCGNGYREYGEECDPQEQQSSCQGGDVCSSTCTCGPPPSLCVGSGPNGQLEPPEECDDGNNNNNDACSNTCRNNPPSP